MRNLQNLYLGTLFTKTDSNWIEELEPFRNLQCSKLVGIGLSHVCSSLIQNKIRDLEPLIWCDFQNLSRLNLSTSLLNSANNRIDDIRSLLYLHNQYNEKRMNFMDEQPKTLPVVEFEENPIFQHVNSLRYPFRKYFFRRQLS